MLAQRGREADVVDLPPGAVDELEGVLACMTTRDWQEGIDAFAAKRKPAFRGE